MPSLKDLVLRLHAAQVKFVVVGGYGVTLHGSSLTTRDVDVACCLKPENLARIFDAFAELHPVHRMTPQRLPFTREQALSAGLKNVYLSTDWGQLDCLGEIKGVGGYSECLAASETLELDGVSIHVLQLDALIQAKRATGRPRDLHAVLELEAIREKLREGR